MACMAAGAARGCGYDQGTQGGVSRQYPDYGPVHFSPNHADLLVFPPLVKADLKYMALR